ncbi:MAG: PRC-barrel domain-containing protein [Candidatus Aenigmatarchaeota archaeon]|nr:PRC-barrel domain-containing protein [Candidatus Aenigmarchaeota archaeon]
MAEKRVKVNEIIGKVIVGESGKRMGIVNSLTFIVETGEILNVVVEQPTKYLEEFNLKRDDNGRYLIPFHAVKSIGDFVIVNENELV